MTAPSPPPLRRPDAWAKRQTFGTWALVYGILLLAAGVGIAVLTLVNDRTDQTVFSAIAGGGGIGAWGLIAIGASLPSRPHPPTLVNAIAVTPSFDRPADDWVHLFRRRRMARVFSIGLVVLGLYMLTLGLGITVLVLTGVEESWLLPLLVLPVLSGVVMLGFGLREVVSRARLATFGRAPTGLTLGPSGVTLLSPKETRFIPWESVVAVRAGNARTRGGPSPYYPIVVLALGSTSETLHLTQYLAPPEVVFSALISGHEDAAFRRSLGTSDAQRVLEGWMAPTAG